ncbi:hypothetical protein NL676_000469 [Syzygium grande]|nr:hypothetical protein NL676_000469 [Syzygium grande]
MVDANVSSVETACTIQLTAIMPGWVGGNHLLTYAQIHKHMVYGFELSWLEKAYGIVTYLSYIVQSIEMIPSYGTGFIYYKLNLSWQIRNNVYLPHALLFLLGIGNITAVFSL